MKDRIVTVIVCLLFLVSNTACTNVFTKRPDESLDFKSVLDVDTRTVLSLGDLKYKFDDALGEGVEREMPGISGAAWYNYAYGYMLVAFIDGAATYISVDSGTNRFKFAEMSFDMIQTDLNGRFEKESTIIFDDYSKYYSESGNLVSGEGNWMYHACISFFEDELVSISLGMNS